MSPDIVDFHISNGYFIKAQRMKQANGCFVEYPRSVMVLNTIAPFITCYFVENDKIRVMGEKEGKSDKQIEINVPQYATRTVIIEDILLQIITLKLNHELLFCFSKDGELMPDINTPTHLLNSPITEDDKEKEKTLLNMLKDVLMGLDCSQQAKDANIYDGYEILKKVFDKGGLYYV
jgi:hypothetical protein